MSKEEIARRIRERLEEGGETLIAGKNSPCVYTPL